MDLFFNDSIEGQSLDFARDLSSHLPAKTKRKIGVGIELHYPNSFRLKGIRDFFAKHGIDTNLAIYKEWTISPTGVYICTTSIGENINQTAVVSGNDETAVTTLIRSIRYYYISNHARPADIVSEIVDELKPEIMKSWKRSYKESEDFLENLTAAANQMFAPVSQSVSDGIGGLSLSAAVPTEVSDLAFDLGMNAINGTDVAHELTQEGSGAQALTLLHFLDLRDNAARNRGFGWIQASIWGMEEPESFLHAGLRSRFSSELQKYTSTDRRQAIITTHDDDFVRGSSHAVIVTSAPGGSQVESVSSRAALDQAARLRITSYRHPLVTHADDPLVIVEGRIDKQYLTAAIRRSGIRPRWRLISPDEDLEPKSSGDALQHYLKVNQSALAARPDHAFVLPLKDWEDGGKSAALDKVVAAHPYSQTIVCPVELCNPELGPRFVGIERYLPTAIVVDVASTEHLDRALDDGTLGIDRDHFRTIKSTLAAAVEAHGDVGEYMERLVLWIGGQVEARLAEVPIERFL